MWVWCKNLWNENSGSQWRFNSTLMLHFFTIFTKIGKMQVLGFGTSYKDGLCPKLSQNWAHKMFYVMLHNHFKELQKYRNLQFLVKICPKIIFYIVREYYIITIYIFTMEIYHNMQYEINGWLLHRFMRTPLD